MERKVLFKGVLENLLGNEVKVGEKAKDFSVINDKLETVSLNDFKGKNIIIAVFPSIDTGVCALQTTKFNKEIANFPKDDFQLVTISVDLPFALTRFCADKGIQNATTVSDHKDLDFGKKYGFILENYRLLARGVVIIDKEGIISHIEYVDNVSNEPNYEKALDVLKRLV